MENTTEINELRQRLDHYRAVADQALAERSEREIHLAVLERRRNLLTEQWEALDILGSEAKLLQGEILGLCYAIGVVAS